MYELLLVNCSLINIINTVMSNYKINTRTITAHKSETTAVNCLLYKINFRVHFNNLKWLKTFFKSVRL